MAVTLWVAQIGIVGLINLTRIGKCTLKSRGNQKLIQNRNSYLVGGFNPFEKY